MRPPQMAVEWWQCINRAHGRQGRAAGVPKRVSQGWRRTGSNPPFAPRQADPCRRPPSADPGLSLMPGGTGCSALAICGFSPESRTTGFSPAGPSGLAARFPAGFVDLTGVLPGIAFTSFRASAGSAPLYISPKRSITKTCRQCAIDDSAGHPMSCLRQPYAHRRFAPGTRPSHCLEFPPPPEFSCRVSLN